MGGYGAILLAEKYPDLFGAAAAISPAIWTSYEQARSVNPGAYASAAAFASADAVTHASALADMAVRVASGASDPFHPGVEALVRRLPRGRRRRHLEGLPHRLVLPVPGPPVPRLPRPPPLTAAARADTLRATRLAEPLLR